MIIDVITIDYKRFILYFLTNTLCHHSYCGESGIRTHDTLLAYTRFPSVPLQPLEHLSKNDESD